MNIRSLSVSPSFDDNRRSKPRAAARRTADRLAPFLARSDILVCVLPLTPDTRGITEKMADTLTGDRIDDKTGNVVR